MRDEREETDVEVERTIEAPRERVWEAWADPTEIARWFVDEARGRIEESGGEITWIWEAMGFEVTYRVTEVEPGHRFELRTEVEGGEARATEVILTGEDGGVTRVRVVESGFGPDPQPVRSGWRMALAALKHYVEEYRGRDMRSVLVMAPADAAPSAILAVQRTAEGLSRWAGGAEPLGAEGEPVRLIIDPGTGLELAGRVLCRTPTETSVTWPEVDGMLELKQFPGPEGRVVALRAVTWADEGAVDLAALRSRLAVALDRFVAALG